MEKTKKIMKTQTPQIIGLPQGKAKQIMAELNTTMPTINLALGEHPSTETHFKIRQRALQLGAYEVVRLTTYNKHTLKTT